MYYWQKNGLGISRLGQNWQTKMKYWLKKRTFFLVLADGQKRTRGNQAKAELTDGNLTVYFVCLLTLCNRLLPKILRFLYILSQNIAVKETEHTVL